MAHQAADRKFFLATIHVERRFPRKTGGLAYGKVPGMPKDVVERIEKAIHALGKKIDANTTKINIFGSILIAILTAIIGIVATWVLR